MPQADWQQYLPEIIGVVGTLFGTIVGTILGWILNNLSQTGRIRFFVSSWKGNMFRQDEDGGWTLADNYETTERYEFTTIVDIYNGKKNPKMLRDIEIVFCRGKKSLLSFPCKDDPSRVVKVDELAPLNIPPQSAIQRKYTYDAWSRGERNEIDSLKQADRVCLFYRCKGRKKHRVILHKEDYLHYFENHKLEEGQNG